MNRLLLLLLAVTLVSAVDEALQHLAKGNIGFTARSYQKQSETEDGNILICGISAQIVLSLLAQGARDKTQSELFQLFSENETSSSTYKELIPELNQNKTDFKLLSANRLYAAKEFEISSKFQKIAEDTYKANIETVNFAKNTETAGLINDWVADNTNNKITDLISSDQLSGTTRLVLVNALYLNGKWQIPFNEYLTKKQAFRTSATESKEIDMMHVEDSFGYKHCGFYKSQFLEMRLRDSSLSFVVVLPDASDDLSKLEKQMDGILEVGDLKMQRVSVTMPRFSTRSKIDFRPILEQLGARTLFQPDAADLTGISSKEGLFVDFVVQQTFINVTEFGVEAAAATAVGVSLIASGPPPAKIFFVADHPFLYFIRDNDSGVTLFAGKFQS